MLDEIVNDIVATRDEDVTFEKPEIPFKSHDKEENDLEQRLADAIMVKMSIRKSNVEEDIRKGDALRPQGINPSRLNGNDEEHRNKTDERNSFKSLLKREELGKNTADSIVDNEDLVKRLDVVVSKLSTKPKGRKGFSVEIEASFGGFGSNKKGQRSFFPGIKSHSDFVDLKEYLSLATVKRGKTDTPMFVPVEVEDVVEIMKDPENNAGNIRCRYDVLYPEDKIFERKIRNNKAAVEIPEIGVRIAYSTENKGDDLSHYESESVWKPHLIRNRRRITFSTRDSTHPFYGFQIDMTAVSESYMDYGKNGESFVEKKILKYEVEIEIISSATVSKTSKEFLDFIVFVYTGLVGFNAPSNVENEIFFDMTDRKIIVDLHNSLFAEDVERTKWRNNTGYTLFDRTYWNKPVNIKIENLLPHFITDDRSTFHLATSFPTLKLNGKRMFMLFLEETCWLVAPPYKVVKFASHSFGSQAAGTYLDGEYFKGTFHVFDILFDAGKNVRKLWFDKRQALVKKYTEAHITPFYGKVVAKKFHMKGDIYERLRAAAEEYEEKASLFPDDTDGIIIQPANEYNNKNTFKWKPAELLTIDFRMNPIPENMLGDEMYPGVNSSNIDRAFVLCVGYDSQIFKPKPVRNADGDDIKFNGIIFVDDSSEHAKWVDTITECKWDGNTFVPVRIRDDRFQPNNYTTAFDVWVDIHNPIGLTTITGEDLVTMRKMHNRIKESTLRRFLKEGDTIVDIGSGRGGDLNKWRKLKLDTVFAIEPNDTNAEEFNRRLESDREKFKNVKNQYSMPTIKLLEVGAEDTEEIATAIKGHKINAMVSFFSLTFFGESEEKYDGLLETIKLVPDGGYFFGAVMDGERVAKLLSKERVKQSRSYIIITNEMKESEDEVNVLIKNPLRNSSKIEVLSKKIETLREEAYDYMPHAELNKLIKSTQKLITTDKKTLKKSESTNTGASKNARETERIKLTIKNRESFVQKLQSLLKKDEIEPLAEDDVVVFNNGVFEIAQLSAFDLSQATQNEIGITISDPTSMVKDQIEWLFNFNIFTEKMNALGFELIESRFIDGKDVSFLSKEAFTFSALNRVFCFRKGGDVSTEILPTKIDQVIPLLAGKNKGLPKDMIIKSVGTKYGSFLHAVLSAVDKDYIALELQSQKDEYVLNFRKTIAEEVTIEEFEKLHGGEMAKRMAYQLSKNTEVSDEDATFAAFSQYKERLLSSVAEVGDVSLLEIVSEKLDLAIYIIGVRDTDIITSYYYSSNKVYCEDVLNHKNAIVLAKSDEFYLVGTGKVDGEEKYTFTKKDALIKKLYIDVCGKK
jgi:hypothetical protein